MTCSRCHFWASGFTKHVRGQLPFFVLRRYHRDRLSRLLESAEEEQHMPSVPRAFYKGARNDTKEASSRLSSCCEVTEGEEQKGHPSVGHGILERRKVMCLSTSSFFGLSDEGRDRKSVV